MATPYEQLLARLLPARRFGVVFGLERMQAIFERLDHPERRLGRVVHVGGTNGKGSTVALIAALLRETAIFEGPARRFARVATYTSPHLSCLRERICFNEPGNHPSMISEAHIVDAAARVTAAGGDELTFFEQLTAIGCVAIADLGVDFTVLEVGLGGRLDATNAIPADVAVVTGVAMDHANVLGDTLDKIALEKAGIFKPGQKVIIGASGEPAAVPVLLAAATRAGARPTVVTEADIAAIRGHTSVPASRLPEFQLCNAANAIAVGEALGLLAEAGAPPGHLLRGMSSLPPGRFELIEPAALDGIHDVVLDGAHNPHAAAALAAEVRRRQLRPILIVAASSDKDVRGIAASLAPVAAHIIATRYQQDRAMAPDALAAVFRDALAGSAGSAEPHGGPSSAASGNTASVPAVETAPDLATAIARATDLAAPFNLGAKRTVIAAPTILITGSLFIVGEARVQLLGAPADPYVVTDPPAK